LLQFVEVGLDLRRTANAIDVCFENIFTHDGRF
jgi:hypothetical protein